MEDTADMAEWLDTQIENAMEVLIDHGEDPMDYRFRISRPDVAGDGSTAAATRLAIQRVGGAERIYDLTDPPVTWLREFEEDLRTSRFLMTLD